MNDISGILSRIFQVLNVLLIFICILLFGYSINSCNKNNSLNKQVEIQQKQIDQFLTRSSNETITQDQIETIIKNNKIDLSKLEKDIDLLNSKIDSVNQVKIVSIPQIVKEVKSSKEEPRPQESKIEKTDDQYLKNKQILDLYENFGVSKVPVGNASFSAWKNSPWEYNIYGRNYNITNIITKTDDDKTVVYNKFSIEVNGVKYDSPISSSTTYQAITEDRFKLYPKLFLTYFSGIDSSKNFNNSIGLLISPLQYGKSKYNSKFSLANIGASYSTNGIQFNISPVLYRIDFLGFIRNVYIGPSFGVNTSKTYNISLALGVSF